MARLRTLIVPLFLFGLLLPTFVPSTQAIQLRRRPEPPEPDASVASIYDWSRLTYQSFSDNSDWEIYVSRYNGDSATRLTDNQAHDMYPRLDRGCKRVAFVSDREGNQEVYIINVDGTGLKRLTANAALDSSPAWSPDGTKIAFESDREGQLEIYVMDADGSDQIRLTDNGAYDGMPSWSPDGQQIAFASDRSGDYSIWIMNSDGSDMTPLSSQSGSQNPAWSPDGTMIAYDADGDDDGWQELYLMNADGTDQRQVYDPSTYSGANYHVWIRSWSPDGKHVAFTETYWVEDQGEWVWQHAQLRAYDTQSENTWTMTYGSVDWRPDWQTADIEPPSSAVDPLPAYSSTDVQVTWSGEDIGLSGLKELDVQYRQGSEGLWVDWKSGIDPWYWRAIFEKQPGQTIYFRSLAVDQAGNEEPLPAGGADTWVTFYDWAIQGTIGGNRAQPIEGASVIAGTQAFEVWPSDANGFYRAYFRGFDYAFSLSWGKDGYGSLPDTIFRTDSDAHHDVFLPPADNVVSDSGFESGALNAGSWQSGGIFAPIVDGIFRHTGGFGAFLGLPFALSPPSPVRDGVVLPEKPMIAADGRGMLHMIWREGSSGDQQIYYAQGTSEGIWGVPVTISSDQSNLKEVLWDATDDGRIHVVWREYDDPRDTIHHAWRNMEGTWSSPQIVHSEGRIDLIRFVVAGDGSGHLLWKLSQTDHDDYYYSRVSPDGAWGSPTPTYVPNDWQISDLAVGPGGRVHLLWHQSGDDIYYSYRQDDGTWSEREHVFPGGYNWYVYLFVDDLNRAHVVWANVQTGKVYHRQRSGSGQWSPVTVLSADTRPEGSDMVALAEPDGTLHVAWPGGQDYSCKRLYYVQMNSHGQWTSPMMVAGSDVCVGQIWLQRSGDGTFLFVHSPLGEHDYFCYLPLGPGGGQVPTACVDDFFDEYPNVTVDPICSVHAVWRPQNSRINYTKTATATVTGDSTVSQQVTIPLTVTNPTLSFAYVLGGGRPDSNAQLEVSVDNGAQVTAIFTTAATSKWGLGWASVSQWSGESVTLTLSAHQAIGEPRLWIWLDEVTLGSAFPDAWIDLQGPNTAKSDELVTLLLSYGNRNPALATGGQVTLTLPTEVDFVSASPAPDTTEPYLLWDVGELTGRSGPTSIVVTLTMPAEHELGYQAIIFGAIRCQTPELQTANNLAQVAIRVGHFVYLPVVVRNH